MTDLSAEEIFSLKSWRIEEAISLPIDLQLPLNTKKPNFEAMAAMSIEPSLPRHRSFPYRPQRSAEVIVVGAGLSGLQTAYELQQSGISCLVLEAQDRLGGRLRSVPCAGGRGVADFGGAWIDAASQPRTVNLVRGLGIEMVEENVKGESVLQGSGKYKFGEVPNVSAHDTFILLSNR